MEQLPGPGHILNRTCQSVLGPRPSSTDSPSPTPSPSALAGPLRTTVCPAQVDPEGRRPPPSREPFPRHHTPRVLEITLQSELRFPACCEGSRDTLVGP